MYSNLRALGLAAAITLVSTLLNQALAEPLPNNCAQDSKKLEELVKSAHFLPSQMDKHIVGHWVGKKFGAKVDIVMETTKSGRMMMDLHVVSRLLGIDMQDKSPVVFCFSNENHIDVHTWLFDESQHVRLRVNNPTTFRILNGKLKATYRKQAK